MSEGLTFAERGMVALGIILLAAALARAAWEIALWATARRMERENGKGKK